jgi:hypothetical protein
MSRARGLCSTRKDDKPVRWQIDRCGRGHVIPTVSSFRIDATAVANDLRVGKLIIEIAVENLAPPAAGRKANAIVEAAHFLQICDEQRILPDAVDPAMDALLRAATRNGSLLKAALLRRNQTRSRQNCK